MGRHTKREPHDDEGAAHHAGHFGTPSPTSAHTWAEAPATHDVPEPGKVVKKSRSRRAMPLPMLPIVAFVLAGGCVTYAYSTSQISLNFGGGGGGANAPQAGPQDSQVSQRNPGQRASRGTDRTGLVVAFHLSGRTSKAFTGTATITNRGAAAVPAWSLAFKIPNATVSRLTGGTVAKVGRVGSVHSAAGAPALAPGQSVKITFVARGVPGGPSVCRLNKLPCVKG